MWNGYPGNAHHHPGGGPGGFAPPPGPPPAGYGSPPPPGFPAPGFAPPPGPPPNGGAYSPSYAPPPGPPPGNFGGPHFSPPPGPPPGPGGFGYPGQGSPYPPHQGPPPGGYAAQPGPPPIPPRYQGGSPFGGRGPSQPGPPGQYGTPPMPPSGTPMRPPANHQEYGPAFEGPNHQVQHPWFQYSQCTGKRKALCIGINYLGQQAELQGCINDARNMQRFLHEFFHYQPEDVVILSDDAKNPRQIPTKRNMIEAMQWLVRDAKPNDSLFFHYSGHGGQTKDTDGDEADGYDEVIYPVDFKTAGHIVDDMMHDIMVRPLPPGCRLTAIFDSCHSGSALDLPYIYSTEGKIKEPNLAAEAGQGLLSAVTSYARGDMSGVMTSVTGLFKAATGNTQKADKIAKRTKTSPADVISWSGCKDSQTSADTVEAGSATGAMSFAFMTALRANPKQSYQVLLNNIRDILRSKYSQKPQLSSSHPIDTSLLFIC
ncbi:hypothetical protein K474DRAFT_1670108 [Panus rudis PR-1116 ss-1]|nr:hypothetical protein K474DRAFT_1670108 [Panus rudis PR-1116 ss-1]